MNSSIPICLQQLKELDTKIIHLERVSELLEWDQETYMPSGAVKGRAGQTALICGLQHKLILDSEWEKKFELLQCDRNGLSELVESAQDRAFVRQCYRRWRKAVNLPLSLVEEMASAKTISHAAWVSARKNNDFLAFEPHLQRIVDLKVQYAQAIDKDKDVYDVLLDDFEPQAKGEEIAGVFAKLSIGLKSLLSDINARSSPDDGFLQEKFPVEYQKKLGASVLQAMGFDRQRGRLDQSAHPFAATLGADDIRLTTRYSQTDILSGLLSTIHEAGHGLYEQNLGQTFPHCILGQAASFGIHESQSLFWEKIVGCSKPFWTYWFKTLQDAFAHELQGVSAEQFYKAVNVVRPSLIRVDADEVTYCFHIIIRFKLEQALFSGQLQTVDIPEAWNTLYQDILGINPPDDAKGCLQDVHWSEGLFGYFPSYALGNLYAAQFYNTMKQQIDNIDGIVEGNDLGIILQWLKDNIHKHGCIYSPAALCEKVSGEALDPQYFLDYLRIKYSSIYELS